MKKQNCRSKVEGIQVGHVPTEWDANLYIVCSRHSTDTAVLLTVSFH